MTKQELAHIAKVMYDLQEYCKQSDSCCYCPAFDGDSKCSLSYGDSIPGDWGITPAGIQRLERGE
jgi:hypothetical protein